MADKKVSQLTALTGAGTASGDLLYIVDVSEPVAADQSKKITLTEFQSAPVSAGTANGVAYLNASKVLTTGSALTFDGTYFTVGASATTGDYKTFIQKAGGELLGLNASSGTLTRIAFGNATASFGSTQIIANGSDLAFITNSAEQMRLTSTGLMVYGTDGYNVQISGGNAYRMYATANDLVFRSVTAGSDVMTLTYGGNVGIGTNNPTQKLAVSSSDNSGTAINIINTSTGGYSWNLFSVGSTASLGPVGSFVIRDSTNGVSRVVLDSSGNLGLGVAPSAWTTNWKAFQFGATSALSDFSNQSSFWNNTVVTGATTPLYQTTAAASFYRQTGGQHIFYTAPSGTAGNAISFTQAMTLDASGNLGIGTTIPQIDANYGGFTLNGTSGSIITLRTADSNVGRIYASGTDFLNIDANGTASGIIVFRNGTSSTERARITSGGDVQVSSGGSVQVGGTAARATTAGTNRIDIFDGTAPVGTLANGVSFYSASGEANVMDAAGNATLLSPHDSETNEWIFRSKHTPTGKVLRIDVERLLRFVNDHFGLDAVKEFVEE
jgi:hypothetical protein